jgi:hypothetical protein
MVDHPSSSGAVEPLFHSSTAAKREIKRLAYKNPLMVTISLERYSWAGGTTNQLRTLMRIYFHVLENVEGS